MSKRQNQKTEIFKLDQKAAPNRKLSIRNPTQCSVSSLSMVSSWSVLPRGYRAGQAGVWARHPGFSPPSQHQVPTPAGRMPRCPHSKRPTGDLSRRAEQHAPAPCTAYTDTPGHVSAGAHQGHPGTGRTGTPGP